MVGDISLCAEFRQRKISNHVRCKSLPKELYLMEGIEMPAWLELAITIFGSVMASSGLWAFITKIQEKKDIKSRMLLGLGHDKIIYLCKCYLKRGYITVDEYENLHDYLYLPYKAMGGNGTAEKLMKEVDQLPTKPMEDISKEV